MKDWKTVVYYVLITLGIMKAVDIVVHTENTMMRWLIIIVLVTAVGMMIYGYMTERRKNYRSDNR